MLGEHADAPGEVWHLPNDPDTATTRHVVELAFAMAGRSPARLRRVPSLALSVVGLVRPLVRELVEMQYQFEEPFIVESTKITKLGATHTPLDTAMFDTLMSYKFPATERIL